MKREEVFMKKEKEILTFHRFKKKQGGSNKKHPKLIVDFQDGFYGHMGLTEQKAKGKHHRNIPLDKNPKIDPKTKKRDQRPAYLRKKIEYDDEKSFYDKPLDDYKLSASDKQKVKAYVATHKKRQPLCGSH